MLSCRMLAIIAACIGTVLPARPASAQDYPTKAIRFYVCCAPGGSADLVTRMLGQKFTERWGQPVIVENRIGGSGVIANDAVAKAPPDGHSMILLTAGHPIASVMLKSMPHDPVEGFGMVSTITSYPFVVSVPVDSPIKSFPDFLATARARPGKLTVAVGGPGSVHHLLAELVNIEAKIDTLVVHLKGAGASVVELLGGRIDLMFETSTATMGHVKGGKIRPIAVSSGGRHVLMPDVPAIAETLPGVEFISWLGLAVSPKTPRPIVDRINQAVRDILAMPDVRTRLAELGGVPMPSSPEEMRTRVEREMARWRPVIQAKGITSQ